jgi:uncharacterized membrane protein HdeD (DUF308 family)
MGNQPVQIEKTGKRYKATQLAGAVLAGVGVAVLANIHFPTGGAIMLAGVVLLFYGVVGAWWSHG